MVSGYHKNPPEPEYRPVIDGAGRRGFKLGVAGVLVVAAVLFWFGILPL